MRKTKKTKNILKIIIISIILILVIFPVLYVTGALISNPTSIQFQDQNLYNAIKNKLRGDKIPYNYDDENLAIEVSKDDIQAITELDLKGTNDTQIINLRGIESFTNLAELNLSGNAITNMSQVSTLSNLKKLNMTGNPVNENILETISLLTGLTELDMTSTKMNGDQLEYFKTLDNLNTLILSNNNISKLTPIAGLSNITKLDISKNTSFTEFSQIVTHKELVELNISGTGISTLLGIKELGNLEKLYAADNTRITKTAGISPLYETYKVDKQTIPYLEKLKILNLSNMGISGNRPTINFSNLAKLTTLEELHLASNEINNLSNVAKLENLNYLDLADNKIKSKDLNNLIQYQTVNGQKYVMTTNTLRASKIDLRENEIIEVSVFESYPADIKYLDLSKNHIYNINPLSKHSFSEALYLQNQNITFGIYEKKVEVDHYIILPNIFKYSEIKGSLVYAENTKINYNGVTLNPNYTNPMEYNVIIDSVKTKEDQLSVTLTGGAASGTVLNFKIGTKSGANVDCLIESILFVDENLDRKICDDLLNRYLSAIKYLERVPKIININQDLIAKVTDFNLQHGEASESTKIRDLTGIENFYNLATLHLQDNDLTTIDKLAACTKLQTLNLANNPNIKDNNSAIEKMPALLDLDLANTGMTNINSINNLTDTFINSKKNTKMAKLNISSNGLTTIEGLEKITSLQKLYIANEKLKDENIQVLEPLKNLETLNISGNQIENINVLSNLNNLKYLYFNNNKIKSLEPINGMIFYELEFADNRVKDISPLYAHHSINNLNMNNNQIEDVSILSGISITDEQILSATGQKMVRVLEEASKGEVFVELPQIFKAAQEQGNKIYTSYELILTKCKLDETKTKVIVNVEDLGKDIAQVSIYGGKASGTILSIAAPLETTVSYSPSNEIITKQNVTATISFNRTEVTIINNSGKNTYTFSENGEFTFEYIDEYGFEGATTVKVTNIDKTAPVITGVENERKYKEFVTPIIKDENLNAVTLTKDGKTVKNYKAGDTIKEVGKYILTATDIVQNTTTVSFEIEQLSDIVNSTEYTVTEKNKLISNIKPGITVSQAKKNLKSEMSFEIIDQNGNVVSETAIVATGYQVKMENKKTYTLIVTGDLNGDGQMNDIDLLRIARYKAGLDKKLTGVYLEAADINQDSNLADDIDLLKMARILVGLDSL